MSITREDFRTYKIDPLTLPEHIQAFIAAIESDDPGLATISAGWDRFRYIVAPNPGGNSEIIERSELTGDMKDRLQAVRKIGMDYGPHRFREDKRQVLALLRGCLPKRRKAGTVADAVGLLTVHPSWTVEQIAEAAGVHVKSLSRSPRFKTARKAAKGAGASSLRRSKNRGNDMDDYEN